MTVNIDAFRQTFRISLTLCGVYLSTETEYSLIKLSNIYSFQPFLFSGCKFVAHRLPLLLMFGR